MKENELFELFGISKDEQVVIKQLTDSIGVKKADGVISLVDEATDTFSHVQSFVIRNPELAAKIIRAVNSNPNIVEKINPQVFEVLKKRFPSKDTIYYIPPIAEIDPMDATLALPAALAVAVAICVLNAATVNVGRAALIGGIV